MPLTLDFSRDYLIWDNPEIITYTSERGQLDRSISIGAAMKQQLSARELAASNGGYVGTDVHWFVPNVLFTLGITPKPADRILDRNGTEWTVLSPALEDLDQVWDLVCRDPVIAYDLHDLVDIYTPINRPDDAGGRVPVYVPSYQRLAAKLQEVTADTEDRHGGRFKRSTFQCFLSRQIDVRPGEDQLRVKDVVYQIESYANPSRIDELMVLTVVRTP